MWQAFEEEIHDRKTNLSGTLQDTACENAKNNLVFEGIVIFKVYEWCQLSQEPSSHEVRLLRVKQWPLG